MHEELVICNRVIYLAAKHDAGGWEPLAHIGERAMVLNESSSCTALYFRIKTRYSKLHTAPPYSDDHAVTSKIL